MENESSTPLTMEYVDKIVEEAHQEIPENSKSLLVDQTTSRFSSAIWYDKIQEKTIILAGVGGIGSYVGFLLGRLKPKSLFLYDDDKVEIGNLSGQLYSREDINKFKVDALGHTISIFADYESTFSVATKFDLTCAASDIMICGFDNMNARKIFYSVWKYHVLHKKAEERKDCLFIDGRLAAEELQVLCIKGDDDFNMKRYEENYSFADSEADATICSYKQTTFMANMIGSIIVNLFVNFVANQCNPIIDRDLPFYTEYSAERMYFKTEA